MSQEIQASAEEWAGIDELKKGWGWFLAMGIVLIILGTVAIGSAALISVVTAILFGWLLIGGGVIEAVHAFWRKKWSGFFLDLLTGLLYVVVGFMVVANPDVALGVVTLLIAMFLIFSGVFRIVAALSSHFPHWGWILAHGIVSLLLGFAIWRQWPWSGLWIIGLFIGIEMVINGFTLVMLGFAAKNLPERPAED